MKPYCFSNYKLIEAFTYVNTDPIISCGKLNPFMKNDEII